MSFAVGPFVLRNSSYSIVTVQDAQERQMQTHQGLVSQSLLATMLDWTAGLRIAALEIYFAQCVSNRVVQHGVVTNL